MLAQHTFAWCWVCAPAPTSNPHRCPPAPAPHDHYRRKLPHVLSHQQGELQSLHGVALSLAFLFPLGLAHLAASPCPPCQSLPWSQVTIAILGLSGFSERSLCDQTYLLCKITSITRCFLQLEEKKAELDSKKKLPYWLQWCRYYLYSNFCLSEVPYFLASTALPNFSQNSRFCGWVRSSQWLFAWGSHSHCQLADQVIGLLFHWAVSKPFSLALMNEMHWRIPTP